MRSSQKKGPRTPGLIRARRLGCSIEAMYAATRLAVITCEVMNAKCKNGFTLINSDFDAHGAAFDAVARVAGYGEPPEPAPATQAAPDRQPPVLGGAEARKGYVMENLQPLGHMAASERAWTSASPECDPAMFGENVLCVYRVGLSPALTVPRPGSTVTPQAAVPHPGRLPRLEADFPARSSADSR